jgi:y4mF family transcriptional regulator
MTNEGRIRTTAELGGLLRAYRKSRGLSQVDAAALAGVGERFLSELERGKPTAEIGLVLKLLDRFGLTLVVAQRGSVNLFDEPS